MVAPLLIAAGDGFSGWQPLNDTIMGGRSQGTCQATSDGLLMEAFVEPEGGGFVSCRSPVFTPPLDLSGHGALLLRLDGDGRRFKLALACRDGVAGLTELIPGGLRWVAEFSTQASGTIGSDCILLIEARDPEGCRLCEGDLELEIYRSGRALHLMLTRLADDRWPMLWHGDHPVWMDPTNGLRCERPADGAPYEAFCRRVRDLLLQG